MTTKFKTYFIVITAVLILSGCESYVSDVRLPEFERKLSIAAFLSPSDTNTFIYVGTNKPLFGELNRVESPGNLSGTISNGTINIVLDTTLNGLCFARTNMPIESGKTYTLKINSDLGISAEALCTVPETWPLNASIDELTFVKHEVMYYDNMYRIYYTMDFNLSFDDLMSENNYYRLAGLLKTYRTYVNSGKQYIDEDILHFDNEYLSDKGVDGSRIMNSTSINIYSADFSMYDSAFLKIYVYRTDEIYQLYHKSLNSYTDGENPFAEVTPVYSNIKGGVGVFCSYIADSLIYKLK